MEYQFLILAMALIFISHQWLTYKTKRDKAHDKAYHVGRYGKQDKLKKAVKDAVFDMIGDLGLNDMVGQRLRQAPPLAMQGRLGRYEDPIIDAPIERGQYQPGLERMKLKCSFSNCSSGHNAKTRIITMPPLGTDDNPVLLPLCCDCWKQIGGMPHDVILSVPGKSKTCDYIGHGVKCANEPKLIIKDGFIVNTCDEHRPSSKCQFDGCPKDGSPTTMNRPLPVNSAFTINACQDHRHELGYDHHNPIIVNIGGDKPEPMQNY